jgi:hypothetical protein
MLKMHQVTISDASKDFSSYIKASTTSLFQSLFLDSTANKKRPLPIQEAGVCQIITQLLFS